MFLYCNKSKHLSTVLYHRCSARSVDKNSGCIVYLPREGGITAVESEGRVLVGCWGEGRNETHGENADVGSTYCSLHSDVHHSSLVTNVVGMRHILKTDYRYCIE